ncbi:MAG: hypothetical protein DRI34_05400 [Deltaproteobacteria bacterium]|nr:MAG: hypothetical protein DRI34_05400 [Deltaproteobacteria bacterium]
MNGVLLFLRRELRLTFGGSRTGLVLAAFALVCGIVFLEQLADLRQQVQLAARLAPARLLNLQLGSRLFTPLFTTMGELLVFVTPLLALPAFLGERQRGSLLLLRACPRSSWALVTGKYLAVLLTVLGCVALAALYALLLQLVATRAVIPWQQVLSGLLGLALLAAGFSALALAVAAASESPLTAGMVAIGVLLGLWMAGWAGSGQAGALGRLLREASAMNHLVAFARGRFRLQDVVYMCSLTAMGLAGAVCAWNVRGRL